MDPRFEDIFNSPENKIFKVVFFPDRIYHARYLNASISSRYRYNVTEVRNKVDITILKGEVYLDERLLTNFLRIEYKAERLVETVREKRRELRQFVMVNNIKLYEAEPEIKAEFSQLNLVYNRNIQAYQTEIWGTLEAPVGSQHDTAVLNMMGRNASITRIRPFAHLLNNIRNIQRVELAFQESEYDLPYGYKIDNPAVDNNYERNYQQPGQTNPTVEVFSYLINFQRGWYIDQKDIDAVPYTNPLMDDDNPENDEDNVIHMRWLLQRELGGNINYFHEVEIPPGKVEGTHQHMGSEELYYFYEGKGEVYMAAGNDPATDHLPEISRPIFQLDDVACKILPAKPGITIYTKSGGIHGVKNTGTKALKFVAFGYHCN